MVTALACNINFRPTKL